MAADFLVIATDQLSMTVACFEIDGELQSAVPCSGRMRCGRAKAKKSASVATDVPSLTPFTPTFTQAYEMDFKNTRNELFTFVTSRCCQYLFLPPNPPRD